VEEQNGGSSLKDSCQKAELSLAALDAPSKGVKIKTPWLRVLVEQAGDREDFVNIGKAAVRLLRILS